LAQVTAAAVTACARPSLSLLFISRCAQHPNKASHMVLLQGKPDLASMCWGNKLMGSNAHGQDPKGWWRLVWCHEHCHKRENEKRRQALRSSLQGLGASLVCLKKANQFAEWDGRPTRTTFALVTDWREAQPCIAYLAQPDVTARPMCMIVLCDSQRQFGRASQWASNLPPEIGSVIVCEKGNIPPTLLNGLIHQCFGRGTDAGALSHSASVTSTQSEDSCGENSKDFLAVEEPLEMYKPSQVSSKTALPSIIREYNLPHTASTSLHHEMAPVKLFCDQDGNVAIVSTLSQ